AGAVREHVQRARTLGRAEQRRDLDALRHTQAALGRFGGAGHGGPSRCMRSSIATIAVPMSRPGPSTPASGSSNFSKRLGNVLRLKRAGSRRPFTSLHLSGQDAGAPGSGRSEYGATIVLPCPFCPQSTYTLPPRAWIGIVPMLAT